VQLDSAALVLEELSALSTAAEDIADPLQGIIDLILGFLEIGDGLIDILLISSDQRAAAGTIEFQVVLQPSERLLALVSALRARDWERFFAEIEGHTCCSTQQDKANSLLRQGSILIGEKGPEFIAPALPSPYPQFR